MLSRRKVCLLDPEVFPDEQAAPLLCAGIIGFRSLSCLESNPESASVFTVLAPAAHLAIQVARHWDVEVMASTRDARHQRLAAGFSARAWGWGNVAEPPEKLDAPIIFAPAGEIVPAALKALRKGGTLVLAAPHEPDSVS